ncbi:hypothetical protein MJO28_006537 [Puccinia striiformis f. sp. tritici]|uniref:Uncharacterized protein n=1 Tax=Puccinia striiformis f. sp. tritici TaxID=168172 RepID=A0ACC0EHV7_9BASI|nr:hypothetical protein MJO28_006537 [Puccinia striiformis f. sp. tritici]
MPKPQHACFKPMDMAWEVASTSNSISPRPYDIGPKLVSKSPHSSSIYAQHHSNVSSTSLPTHWDLVKYVKACKNQNFLF